jgi:hypothetical protein
MIIVFIIWASDAKERSFSHKLEYKTTKTPDIEIFINNPHKDESRSSKAK